MPKKSDAENAAGSKRSSQIARAQDAYRSRKREGGFQRLQEWLPESVNSHLQCLCDATGLTKREALVRLINSADIDKLQLSGSKNDDRKQD